MKIIVISKNQNDKVQPMKAALSINPLFVFDRTPNHPTDVDFIENNDGEGFLAGKMRDLGANGIDDDILFLDGDKIPQGDIVSDITRLRTKYDCIIYGIDPDLESDSRFFMRENNTDGIIPSHLTDTTATVGCYSCGIWLSKAAIAKLREMNNGRIFNAAFDGHWGDEDNFLGDELKHAGFRVGYSTHVRLSGQFGKFNEEKQKEYAFSFIARCNAYTDLIIKNE